MLSVSLRRSEAFQLSYQVLFESYMVHLQRHKDHEVRFETLIAESYMVHLLLDGVSIILS